MASGDEMTSASGAIFASWLRRAREDAGWSKTDAIAAVAEVGIKERTYTHWESGTITKPNPRDVRKACLRLGLEVREAAVALGILTRDELELPPPAPRIPRTILHVLSLLRDTHIPENAKTQLLKVIDAAVEFWYSQLGVRRPPREPSARERAEGKPVIER